MDITQLLWKRVIAEWVGASHKAHPKDSLLGGDYKVQSSYCGLLHTTFSLKKSKYHQSFPLWLVVAGS